MKQLIKPVSLLSVGILAGVGGFVAAAKAPSIASAHGAAVAVAAPACAVEEKDGVYFASCGDFTE